MLSTSFYHVYGYKTKFSGKCTILFDAQLNQYLQHNHSILGGLPISSGKSFITKLHNYITVKDRK